MTRLVVVLVGVACVVVIAAGSLWLWQQVPAPSQPAIRSVSGPECAGYIEALQRDASTPGSITAEQKQAATDGVIRCRDAGIR